MPKRIFRDWSVADAQLAEMIAAGQVRTLLGAAEALDINPATLRGHLRDEYGIFRVGEMLERYPQAYAKRESQAAKLEPGKTQIEHLQDRSVIIERLMAITEEDGKDPARILTLLGYDSDLWQIVNLKITLWTGQRGQAIGGGAEPLSAVRAQLKPRMIGKTPAGDLMAAIGRRLSIEVPPLPTGRRPRKTKSGAVAELPQADWHLDSDANGVEYDAQASLSAAHAEMLERTAKAGPLAGILLPVLGDIYHYDTMARTTTGGTPMGTARGPHDMIDLGVDLMAALIRAAAEIAPVEVIHVPGNHDQLLAYTLLVAMAQRYSRHKHVTFDLEARPRKWRLVGVNLVAWMHGELPKSRAANWLPVEAAEEWGRKQYAEIHAGHLHSRVMTEAGGVIVQHLPSPAPLDEWHHKNAYVGASRGMMAFLWEPERPGWREQWFAHTKEVMA